LKRLRSFVVLKMSKLSSSTLRKGAEIQEEIEKLEVELADLLTAPGVSKGGEGNSGSRMRGGTNKTVARLATKKADTAGRARPSGVAAGVRQILQSKRKPMKVGEVYTRLLAKGYSFRSSNPKNSLTAQIYRMRGVRRTGPGEFAAE
jgi:hypothetical protein